MLKRFTALFMVAATALASVPEGMGATPPAPRPVPGGRTNAPAIPAVRPPAGRSNTVPVPGRTNAIVGRAGATNAASAKATGPDWLNKVSATYQRVKVHPAFLPTAIGLGVAVSALVIALVVRRKSRKPGARPGAAVPALASQRAKKKAGKVHACNVLQVGPDARELYQFEARTGGFALTREHGVVGDEPLPRRLVQKDWRALFQRKLNVAWLPAENVFLRVAQLPASDLDETLSMVEFQLEKLSPMPVNQIVWTMHALPKSADNMQTVIVIIVARSVVEDFLGRLEAQGYLADRLELPLLDQLQATPFDRDGAWLYPDTTTGRKTALVAWTSGGVIQNLDLLTLPATNPAASAKEQLLQMAWAGEMEGWLKASPEWTLVADGTAVSEWELLLREGLEQPIHLVAPTNSPELAALTARRAAQADARVNLVPPEFTTRYQQLFVDRLWMRGLGAVVGLYLVGVLIYFVAVQFALYRTRSVETEVALRGPTYTNALQLKAQYEVLKDRQELKFAALDCWSTAASLLPEGLTLDTLSFSEGRKLTLTGTAPSSQTQDILKFEGDMRKAKVSEQRLFTDKGDSTNTRANPGGSTVTWSFSLELRRAETL